MTLVSINFYPHPPKRNRTIPAGKIDKGNTGRRHADRHRAKAGKNGNKPCAGWAKARCKRNGPHTGGRNAGPEEANAGIFWPLAEKPLPLCESYPL